MTAEKNSHEEYFTHLDLFTGIGGFAIAAQSQGFRTVAFSEIEPYARRLLAERFPGIPNFGNVKRTPKFAGLRGKVLVGSAGYPCQPDSLAGKRGGASDGRWLWPSTKRVLKVVQPPWFIGENVLGHVTLGLDQVLSDLEALGYEAQAFTIPACAVDAPHRRERVWVIGYNAAYALRFRQRQGLAESDEARAPWDHDDCGALANADGGRGRINQPGRKTKGGTATGGGGEALADTAHEGPGRRVELAQGVEGSRHVADAKHGGRKGRKVSQGRQSDAGSGGENVSDADGDGRKPRIGGIAGALPPEVGRVYESQGGGGHGPGPDANRSGRQAGRKLRAGKGQPNSRRVRQADADAVNRGSQGVVEARSAAPSVDGSGPGRHPGGWLVESGLCRVADGLSFGLDGGSRWPEEDPETPRVCTGVAHRAHRLKGLGNAIVPENAVPFFHWIRQIETGEIK